MKAIIIFTAFIILCTPVHATCIVILIKNNTFYVGADSRRVVEQPTNAKKRKIKYEKIKKIHSSNGIYIAISGHDDSSLLSVAILATKKKLSVDDRVEYFRKSMTSRYKDVMESHKYYDSTLYKRYLKAYLAEVSFFGFIDKKPFIQTVSFLAKECNGIITISSKIAKQEPMTLLGIYDHVQEVKINPPTTQEIVITKIIKNEMKHHPEIGNPIDFLILNAQGPEWKKIN